MFPCTLRSNVCILVTYIYSKNLVPEGGCPGSMSGNMRASTMRVLSNQNGHRFFMVLFWVSMENHEEAMSLCEPVETLRK